MTDIWADDNRRRSRRFWTIVTVTVALEAGAVIGLTADHWIGWL